MKSVIFADAQELPDLFRWNGSVDADKRTAGVRGRGWVIPSDLLAFWAITNGGDVFESETFLQPLLSSDQEGGVEQVTNWRKTRGLPKGLVVFHEGLGFTAVSTEDGAYLWFEEDTRIGSRHTSFETWYVEVLRAEYGARYGLDPL